MSLQSLFEKAHGKKGIVTPEAVVANEIRNPLSAIRFQIEVLRDQLDPLDSRRDAIDQTLKEVDRVARTVEEVLDYGEPRAARRGPCDLRAVISGALLGTAPTAEERNVTINEQWSGNDFALVADPGLLAKAVRHLLANAVEASPENGEVTLTCEETSQELTIAVRDEGAGMEPETLERLGKPFFSTKTRGLGLGVHLALRDTRRLGGEIRFQSSFGEGTLATIHLRRPDKQS